ILEEIGHVRNDHIDAESGRVGKHHSAVDDDGVLTVLDHHEIHPDLAETAERDDAEGRVVSRSRSLGVSHRRFHPLRDPETARPRDIMGRSDSTFADTEWSLSDATRLRSRPPPAPPPFRSRSAG